jgi:hypothetical protein
MRLRPAAALLFSLLLGTTSAVAQDAVVSLEPAFPEMKFSLPVAISPLPGSKDVVFVVEKGDPAPSTSADKSGDKKKKPSAFLGGKVQMISGLVAGQPVKREVFQLNPKDGKFDAAGECGFLGFAVHPKYKENKQVFVYYSLRIDGKLHQRISRFLLSSVEPFLVDPSRSSLSSPSSTRRPTITAATCTSVRTAIFTSAAATAARPTTPSIRRAILIRASTPRSTASTSTRSRATRPQPPRLGCHRRPGRGLLCRPLRQPVPEGHLPPRPPLEAATVRTETWATGLRNAWRFSFDPKTGACFTGDVGQGLYEEIDILVAGGDYGWHDVEGFHVFNQKDSGGKKAKPELAPASAYKAPIHEYDRKLGNSVTGGVVCRGDRVPAIADAYVFGDFASGRIFSLHDRGGRWESREIARDATVAGFGHDPSNGDVLVASLTGQVKRIVKK